MLAAIFLCIPAFLLVCGFLLPACYDDSFMGELKYKVELLRTTEGRRLIVLGGSGAAFGMDSGLIEKELPEYHVINFGMYAALGTKAMLELSEPFLREGDIVIISPEQNPQTLSDYFDARMLWQGADGAFEMLRYIDRADAGSLAAEFPYFAVSKLRYAVAGGPDLEGIYRRTSFGDKGDIRPELRERNILPAGYDPTTPVEFTPDAVGGGFFELLNGYARSAEKKGAAVYYRFCPVNALAVTAGDIDDFYDYLASGLSFPILGDPRDSVLEAGWFFDTNFHLNAAGAVLNSRNIVRSLKAELGDSTPTKLAVPVMPEPAGEGTSAGDDSMADYFIYEDFSGGLKIVGVRGDPPQRLVLPGQAEGKAVLAVERVACGAEEIVIPENIRAIFDGAFAECPVLRRIELRSADPSQCAVGGDLLTGTEADIYVPPEAADAYRLSYAWSRYASRIHPQIG